MIKYNFSPEHYDKEMHTIILPMMSIAPFVKHRNETGKYPPVNLISSTGKEKVFTYESEIFGGGFYYVCGGLRLKLLY